VSCNVSAPVVDCTAGQDAADVTASKPQHITCLLSDSGLLWIGTSAGFVLTIPLPRLEGMPQVHSI